MNSTLSSKEKEMGQLALAAYQGIFDFKKKPDNPLDNSLQKKQHSDMSSYLETLGLDNHEIVWGPAISYGFVSNVPAAFMFITKIKGMNEYTVVIRGTNPISFFSWLNQDLDVGKQTSWNKVASNVSDDGSLVSNATATAIKIHAGLTAYMWYSGNDKYNLFNYKNYNFCEYLEQFTLDENEQMTLNFTGHSLGGVMSSTLAEWFVDSNPDLAKKFNINVYALACPTAGNQTFANRVETTFKDALHVYINNSDAAPHAWNSLQDYFTNLLNNLELPDTDFEEYMLQEVPKEDQNSQSDVRKLWESSQLSNKLQTMYSQLQPVTDIPMQKMSFQFNTETVAGKIIWMSFYCAWQHIVPYAVAFSDAKCTASMLLKPFLLFDPQQEEIDNMGKEQISKFQSMLASYS